MEERIWEKFSPEEKLIAIEAYLDGMVKLDDGDEAANGERLEWLRTHLPAFKPDGEKNYIFVSYSHRDYKQVYRDLAYFTYNSERKVRFWYDEGLPIGQSWGQAAEKFLADSNCVGVVFYLSKNLLLSPSVYEEIKLVKKYKRPYVSVATDGTYSASAIVGEEVEKERFEDLRRFFPEENTALSYGADFESALYRINKIGEAFNVTEEVLSDFVCEETADGLRLAEYRGNKTEVYIPEAINGKPITEICCDFPYAVKIHIPKTVKKISAIKNYGYAPFRFSENLEEIKVAAASKYFFDLNGVLCDRKKSSVICAPINWDWHSQLLPSGNYKNNKNLEKALAGISLPFFLNAEGYEFLVDYSDKDVMNTYEIEMGDAADLYEALYKDNLSVEEYAEALNSPRRRYELYKKAKQKSIFNKIKKIGADAFFKSRRIDYLFLPDGITEISRAAFCQSNLKLVYLPENLNKIESSAFLDCTRLSTVLTEMDFGISDFKMKGQAILRGNIKYIGGSAFRNTSIQNIVFGDNISEIEDSAFYGCVKLKKALFPGGVERVNEQVFADCTLLSEVEIQNGVKRLGGYAFVNCLSLHTVKIPKTVKSVSLTAFIFCESLENIYYDGTVDEWEQIKFSNFGKIVKFDLNFFRTAGADEKKKITVVCTDGKIG